MLKPNLAYVFRNFVYRANVCVLSFDNGQPAKPVSFICTGPQGRVFLPHPRNFMFFLPFLQRTANRVRQVFRQAVSLSVDHAFTPALLPVVVSNCVNASAKSLTPSTTSLSVTSFMEIPAFSSASMVFWAPGISSVRLARNFP